MKWKGVVSILKKPRWAVNMDAGGRQLHEMNVEGHELHEMLFTNY